MPSEPTGRQSDPPRVIVVDDEALVVEMLETRLERGLDGVVVDAVTDPRACLSGVDEGGVDCIVSDYDMPDMNGLELLRRVRKIDRRIPFILYTGRGSEEIASEAISVGVTDYVRKGGTDALDVLTNSVERALTRRRTEAEREAARQSLAEKDATLESLFESLPSPCVLVDADRTPPTVRRTNGTFDRQFDVDPSDAIGSELDAVVDADESLSRTVTVDGIHRMELQCETVAGQQVFLATVVPVAGEADLRYLVLTDISEQKRLQRSLTALHDATRELLRCEDAATVERTALEAAADVIGFPYNGTRRYDVETDSLVPSETTDAAAEHFDRSRSAYSRDDPDAADAWNAFETGEVVSVEAGEQIQRDGVASKVYLPVGKWGVITLSDPERCGVDETEQYLGRILAANMAAVLSQFDDGVVLRAERR